MCFVVRVLIFASVIQLDAFVPVVSLSIFYVSACALGLASLVMCTALFDTRLFYALIEPLVLLALCAFVRVEWDVFCVWDLAGRLAFIG